MNKLELEKIEKFPIVIKFIKRYEDFPIYYC